MTAIKVYHNRAMRFVGDESAGWRNKKDQQFMSCDPFLQNQNTWNIDGKPFLYRVPKLKKILRIVYYLPTDLTVKINKQ
jgi:hypothetical protein